MGVCERVVVMKTAVPTRAARKNPERPAFSRLDPDEGDAPIEDSEIRQLHRDYGKTFDEESFWRKVFAFAVRAGKRVIHLSLVLYFCLLDPGTPKWVKASIIGALGYFVLPTDAIPDVIPVTGFSDDLGVLAAAVTYLGTNIKEEHRKKAGQKLGSWFR